jgi:hypothetical protein
MLDFAICILQYQSTTLDLSHFNYSIVFFNLN